MKRKNITLGGAAAGVVAGVVGLAVLAAPAGAGTAPSLPKVSPSDLVQSVLTAKHQPFGGTVEIHNGLGLPAVPGLPPQATAGSSTLRVWSDGADRSRLAVPNGSAEETIVNDGKVTWDWNSGNGTVTKTDHAAEKPATGQKRPGVTKPQQDPATMAKDLIGQLQKTSDVSVDGTSTVAGRPAYDLVLTPKPNEKTLLREVRVSVDSATRMPLQVSVLANGSPDPALQVGFSKLTVGPQDQSLFTFTPPARATVQDKSAEADKAHAGQRPQQQGAQQPGAQKQAGKAPQVVGDGWDAVAVGTLPATDPTATQGGKRGKSQDPMSMIKRIGTPVSGPWGQGYLVSTKVGAVLITSDGRFAAGAVPQQVLTDAIGSVK